MEDSYAFILEHDTGKYTDRNMIFLTKEQYDTLLRHMLFMAGKIPGASL